MSVNRSEERPVPERNHVQDRTTLGAVLAVSCAVLHEGRFLLVRRGRAPALGLYAFPGGKVEPGETLAEAAEREVMEETGVRVRDVAPVVDIEVAAEDETGRVEFILCVHSARHDGGEAVPADDADEAGWYTLDEMEALPLAGSVMSVARDLAATPSGHPD